MPLEDDEEKCKESDFENLLYNLWACQTVLKNDVETNVSNYHGFSQNLFAVVKFTITEKGKKT